MISEIIIVFVCFGLVAAVSGAIGYWRMGRQLSRRIKEESTKPLPKPVEAGSAPLLPDDEEWHWNIRKMYKVSLYLVSEPDKELKLNNESLHFPNRCVCCGGTPDTKLECDYAVSWSFGGPGYYTTRSSTRSFAVPYCKKCHNKRLNIYIRNICGVAGVICGLLAFLLV